MTKQFKKIAYVFGAAFVFSGVFAGGRDDSDLVECDLSVVDKYEPGVSLLVGGRRFFLPENFSYIMRNDGGGYFSDLRLAAEHATQVVMGEGAGEGSCLEASVARVKCRYGDWRIFEKTRDASDPVSLIAIVNAKDEVYLCIASTDDVFWKRFLVGSDDAGIAYK